MNAKARKALLTVRSCVATKRYRLLSHCTERMDQRGLVWPDVLAVLDEPGNVRDSGRDRFGRPKWLLAGTAPDGDRLELVCALDADERGAYTVFITIY